MPSAFASEAGVRTARGPLPYPAAQRHRPSGVASADALAGQAPRRASAGPRDHLGAGSSHGCSRLPGGIRSGGTTRSRSTRRPGPSSRSCRRGPSPSRRPSASRSRRHRAANGRIAFAAAFSNHAPEQWTGQEWVVVAGDESPWAIPVKFESDRRTVVAAGRGFRDRWRPD